MSKKGLQNLLSLNFPKESPEGPWWVVVGVHDPARHLDPAIVATTMKNSVTRCEPLKLIGNIQKMQVLDRFLNPTSSRLGTGSLTFKTPEKIE